jgi:tetratricopeptide (TPR) repeat protein
VRRASGIVAFLVGVVLSAQTADQQFEAALQLQRKGDLQHAQRAYEQLLATSPDRIDALSNLGLVYGELGHYNQAIETFQKALKLAPDQPNIQLNLAMTYLEGKQYESAEREAAGVESQQPSNALAHYVRGLALLKLDQLQDGISQLEFVRNAQPGNLKMANTLESAYLRAHQFDKAKDLVDKTLSHADTAESHLMTGTFYLVTGDVRDAVPELQQAQKLDPRLSQLGSSLAEAYALSGNSDVALKMFKSQLAKNPSDFEANSFLGWLCLESEQLEQAEKYLARAHAIQPNDPGVKFQLARLARAQNDNVHAAELLEQVVAQQPENASAHVLLATVYFRLKRIDDGKREREIANRLSAEQQARQAIAANSQ